jgi:hypothetical protein
MKEMEKIKKTSSMAMWMFKRFIVNPALLTKACQEQTLK